jgi:hypothetical protein
MSAFDFSSLDLTDYGPPTQLGARTPPLGAINASTRERRRQLSALRLSLLDIYFSDPAISLKR